MEEVAAPAQVTLVKKTPKKKVSKTKKTAGGPVVGELIKEIVSSSKDRKGVSVIAIRRELRSKGYDVDKKGHLIKNAIKNLVKKGDLVHVTGSGAAGSFKVQPKAGTKVKKIEKKVTTPNKSKDVPVKKSAVTKASVKRAASPKKVKKPAAKTQKTASKPDKKIKKSVGKVKTVKRPVSRRSPVKKTTPKK